MLEWEQIFQATSIGGSGVAAQIASSERQVSGGAGEVVPLRADPERQPRALRGSDDCTVAGNRLDRRFTSASGCDGLEWRGVAALDSLCPIEDGWRTETMLTRGEPAATSRGLRNRGRDDCSSVWKRALLVGRIAEAPRPSPTAMPAVAHFRLLLLMTFAEDSGPQYILDGIRMRPGDAEWQRALEGAYARDVEPLCLCRQHGVPMYIAHYRQYVVKRLPETGHRHHPTCPSYEQPPSQSGLGEVLGEAVIERAPDRVEVRLEFPLTRRIGRPVPPSEPGEVRTEVVAHRRGLGLRGRSPTFVKLAPDRWLLARES